MVYNFKAGAHFKAGFDREAGATRLATILERDGQLELPAIIADGLEPSSPLHTEFEITPEEAVQAFHEKAADYLRRQFVVIVTDEDTKERREFRAVVPVFTVKDADHRSYVSMITAMSDEEQREQILWSALQELIAIRRKYRDLRELERVFSAIDATAKKIRKETAA
jgi:hypothetical protein